MRGKLTDDREIALGGACKLLRMDADGGIDKGVFLRKRYCGAGAFHVAAGSMISPTPEA